MTETTTADEKLTFEAGIMSSKWKITSPCIDSGIARLRIEQQTTAPIAIYTEGVSSDLCNCDGDIFEEFMETEGNADRVRASSTKKTT